MKLTFLGASQTVTGSKYLLETKSKSFLIDCGLFQGKKENRLKNWEPLPYPAEKIDAVILTHAHIDHSGYLPLLVRQGFRGAIYASSATIDLCKILLMDAAHIYEEDAKRANRYGYTKHKPALPLYTQEEAEKTLEFFEPINFHQPYNIDEEVELTAHRAGHILGSAFITLKTPKGKLVFSGDVGRPGNPVMNAPEPIEEGDFLILESTYGGRDHPEESPTDELRDVIKKTAKQGGKVLIPSFAVGRAQMVMAFIQELKAKGEIPDLPVYLDSPMAQNATNLLKKHLDEHRLDKKLCDQVCSIATYTRTQNESKALNDLKMPAIIISASGMAEGGRVLHHLIHLAPHPENAIVFAGFQAAMTRGDRILRGERSVKIHGAMVPIRARVERLESLSSHADSDEMVSWLKHLKGTPKRVFLTHGEPSGCIAFQKKLKEAFGWDADIPALGDTFTLE